MKQKKTRHSVENETNGKKSNHTTAEENECKIDFDAK